MVMLYTFKCEHGKSCNFSSDCPECAKNKIQTLRNQVAELEADAKRYRWLAGFMVNKNYLPLKLELVMKDTRASYRDFHGCIDNEMEKTK